MRARVCMCVCVCVRMRVCVCVYELTLRFIHNRLIVSYGNIFILLDGELPTLFVSFDNTSQT